MHSYQIHGYKLREGTRAKCQKEVNRGIPSGGSVTVDFYNNGVFSHREILKSK